jgi:hypothetical protein
VCSAASSGKRILRITQEGTMSNEASEQDRGRVSEATRAEESREATMPADAGRPPTADEEAAADRSDLDPGVADENKAAVERGAHAKGEGRIP